MSKEDLEIKKLKEELKQTREMLYQTSKLAEMGKQVAVVAHELSQPLLGIKAFSQILRRRYQHDQYAEPKIRIIEEQAEHMEAIIGRLRQYSKKVFDESQTTDPMIPIKTAFELLHDRLNKLRIHIDLEGPEKLPRVLLSQGLLQQIIVNLMNNSLEELEGRKEGRILIQIEATDQYVIIRVADNGRGIPEHTRNRLFEPFFTTKGKEKGTGLGLSICYDILQDKYGKIRLMDQAEVDKVLEPGLGATFELSLAIALQPDGEDEPNTG